MLPQPAVMGDDRMFVGKLLSSYSDVLIEGHPEVSGTVSVEYEVLSRDELVRTCNDQVYGDCFKVRERTSVSLHNNRTNQSFSDSAEITRLLAENVGPVRIEFGNQHVDLIDLYHSGSSLEQKVLHGSGESVDPRQRMACKIRSFVK